MPSNRFGYCLSVFAVVAGLAGAQVISNAIAPVNGFVDISLTGTPVLGTGDDTSHFIQTTVGNTLFPAGDVLLTPNGVAISGVTSGFVPFTNTAPPTGNALPSFFPENGAGYILAYWDDLITVDGFSNATIFWQEIGGTLYITWKDIAFFNGPVADFITFQIQVFGNPSSCGPLIQILYQDTVAGSAGFDNGASATIGYASPQFGVNGIGWSFNGAGAVMNGTTLSISFPASSLTASSPFGAGSLQIDFGPSACTLPNASYIFLVTLNQNPSPFGTLNIFGLEIGFFELANEIAAGLPFVGPLDAGGGFHLGPFTGLPPVTLSGVVIEFDGAGNVNGHSNLLNYTIP